VKYAGRLAKSGIREQSALAESDIRVEQKSLIKEFDKRVG
jgi:hypothetical protein